MLAVFAVGLGSSPSSASASFQPGSISTSSDFTCAIRTSGQAVCWGYNGSGQLGDGTDTTRYNPVPVQGLSNAAEISTGDDHTCAIRTSGQAVCWGANDEGQIGEGTWDNIDRLTPTPVTGLSDAKSINAGGDHTCAIRTSGQVVCWGDNYEGQIGDGTREMRITPTAVLGLSDAKSISAGDEFTCAVRISGQAVCWGDNFWGQLGDGTEKNRRLVPTSVLSLSDAKSISAGLNHTCAVRTSGQAVCWGINYDGQVGNNTWDNVLLVPTAVQGLSDAKSIGAGNRHSCAIRTSGQAVCWGSNGSGQIGNGSISDGLFLTPAAVQNLADGVFVSSSEQGSCAIRTSGQAVCWGRGYLGDGNSIQTSRVPIEVIEATPTHQLSLTKAGSGLGTVSSTPAGINCGQTCSAAFNENTKVTLTGTPSSGSTFTGWSGACSGTSSPCKVTMSEAKTVTARFTKNAPPPVNHTLTVTKSGTGSGTVTSSPAGVVCGSDCSQAYLQGTQITLTASAASGSTFTGWSGACAGSTLTCGVTMSQARTATATFTKNPPPPPNRKLTASKSGTGSGTVTSTPAGISCGADCSEDFEDGLQVTLKAVAASGSTFSGWSGACAGSGSAPNCQVTMSEARSVIAMFAKNPTPPPPETRTLTVTRSGAGSGTVRSTPAGINCGTDCSGDFEEGIQVTLTAAPSSGSTFAGWSGACSSSTSTCVVTLNNAKSVTANFRVAVKPPPPGKPVLGPLKVSPRSKTVKRGKSTVFRVQVKNIGDATATYIKVCATSKMGSRCAKLGSIGAGSSRTAAFKVTVKRTAKKGAKLTIRFAATGKGVAKRTGTARVRVK